MSTTADPAQRSAPARQRVTTPSGLSLNYRPLAPGSDHLREGRRVFWQRTEFDCLRCCIATVLGCGYDDVPPEPGDGHSKVEELAYTEQLHAWVRERGYRTRYEAIARPLFNRLFWIGVSIDPRPGFDHTVVCRCRTVVFDPALAFEVPPGFCIEPISKLDYAIAFERLAA